MSTKKYIKSHSDDQFEKVTGIKLYEVDGQLGCRIVPNSRMLFAGKQYMARFVAASIYLETPISDLDNVETTCGVKNCVLPSHIIVNNKNLKVNSDGKVSSPEIEPEVNSAYEQYIINNSWGKTEDQIEELRTSIYGSGIPKK